MKLTCTPFGPVAGSVSADTLEFLSEIVDPMPYFDRYDICAAYAALEIDYQMGGLLVDRPSCRRRNKGYGESVFVQLNRIGYRASQYGRDTLTDNARAIYDAAEARLFGEWKG